MPYARCRVFPWIHGFRGLRLRHLLRKPAKTRLCGKKQYGFADGGATASDAWFENTETAGQLPPQIFTLGICPKIAGFQRMRLERVKGIEPSS